MRDLCGYNKDTLNSVLGNFERFVQPSTLIYTFKCKNVTNFLYS